MNFATILYEEQDCGEAQELGWAATLLCSPVANCITGHTLVVDGGNWLRRSRYVPGFAPIREMFAKWRAGK